MRVTVTGATGLIGGRLVEALVQRGDSVTVLSRSPEKARAKLGVDAVAWDGEAGPAPADALSGRDGVIHLAGEPVAQRWTAKAKERIRASRELGTRNLVAGIGAVSQARPRVLVSASAVGFYGPRGDEPIDESAGAGSDFLAEVTKSWEDEAQRAAEHGVRVVTVRTGIVLDPAGGALGRMLTPFKLGAGGPVAGGRQYMPWIHPDDIVGIFLWALDNGAVSGPVNGTAPAPVTNRTFSKTLGRVLRRPAFMPAPSFGLRMLFGEMAEIVTAGQNALPKRTQELGYRFRHPELEAALRDVL